MAEYKNIRKKANAYFFSKIIFNILLIIFGAYLISLFFRQMQNSASLYKQQKSSEQVLNEVVDTLETNEQEARDLTEIFHDGNQDILDDLANLLTGGMFDDLASADNETRSEGLADIIERSGVQYLFVMGKDGKILLSPVPEFYGRDLTESGLMNPGNARRLQLGTVGADGIIYPVYEKNDYGEFYFYSVPLKSPVRSDLFLILGADSGILDLQINTLRDVSAVLRRAVVGNDGFMFAVSKTDKKFLYYENGNEVRTGQNAMESGLSEEALKDGYAGKQVIGGTEYFCVSRDFGSRAVVCAVAVTGRIYSHDRYVLFWSISAFVIIMLLCLIYTVIVRNDYVRNEVTTDKFTFSTKKGHIIIFDKTIFRTVFPLMVAGVLMIFALTFYTQTLLEISQSIDNSTLAIEEIQARYSESLESREMIREYYDSRFLAKANMIAYLIGEDPEVLNAETDRYYTYFDEDGKKLGVEDDEGNTLRSVISSPRLQELCEANNLESIYVFDEEGHTIATNTPYWFFTVSHNPEDQSYPFLEVVDGKKDALVQEAMENDLGMPSQYIGVEFHYYTAKNEDGETVYVSRRVYENDETAEEPLYPSGITAHRSMLQVGLDSKVSEKVMASTDIEKVLSSDILSGGFVVLFDNSPEHICLYSPNAASIGKTREEMGISDKAFSGNDYFGYERVNGERYFQYFRFLDDYFIGTAIPVGEMYQARMPISLITTVTSLILILFLSATVILTTKEEEYLYETISEANAGDNSLDATIFNIILPSGRKAATVKAAARWDNSSIPWNERTPEQKLLRLLVIIGGILIVYVIITVFGIARFFDEGSVLKYILSGNWDRGRNIFAVSASLLVLVFTTVLVAIFRIPARITSSLLGARGETIAHLLLSVVKYGGTLGAVFYCMYLFGMDSQSILASAGVFSLVVGLGAQSLIKDIIAGIFIVFEGEFRVGDIVTIGGYRGTVMDIGLRTTKILGVEGNIKIFNNSDITGVLNMTKEASYAFCRISVEYGQDIDYVEAVLTRDLPSLKDMNSLILEGPTYSGVGELGDSGITLVVFCKCHEKDIIKVQRFMNREILKIFYANGINVPFPHVTVTTPEGEQRKTMQDFTAPEKEEQGE